MLHYYIYVCRPINDMRSILFANHLSIPIIELRICEDGEEIVYVIDDQTYTPNANIIIDEPLRPGVVHDPNSIRCVYFLVPLCGYVVK